jgi:hypothetical protein
MLGFNIQGEVGTSDGRINAVLLQEEYAIIVKIKYSVTKSFEKMLNYAIKQIKDTHPYKLYLDKKIILLSIACKIEHR